MKMNMEDAKKALEFINSKTGGLQCPMCKQRIFDLAQLNFNYWVLQEKVLHFL